MGSQTAESLLILSGRNESAYHASEIPGVSAIQDVKLVIVATLIDIAAEITKILQQDECRIQFLILKQSCVDGVAGSQRPALLDIPAGVVLVDQRLALAGKIHIRVKLNVRYQSINKQFRGRRADVFGDKFGPLHKREHIALLSLFEVRTLNH